MTMTSKTTTDAEVPLEVLRRQRLARVVSRLRHELAEIEMALSENRFGHLLALVAPRRQGGNTRLVLLSNRGRVIRRPDWWNHGDLTVERGRNPPGGPDAIWNRVPPIMPERRSITELLLEELTFRKQLLREVRA